MQSRCYTWDVPTTKPRYTFTDTGELEQLLDRAQRMWPDVSDRKELLYRLARAGGEAVEVRARDAEALRARQREALERAPQLIDVGLLLSDAAWR
jgi:hypothetical protein